MSNAVRVIVDSAIKTCDTLKVYVYLWLRDQNDTKSMWNDYLRRLLNDSRVSCYLEGHHIITNRVSDHLKLFGWLINTILSEKRLLAPADVIDLWKSFNGEVNDDHPVRNLTTDGKILLATICNLLAKSIDGRNQRVTFSYYEMQDEYDALRKETMTKDPYMFWVEPSYDVSPFFSHFFLLYFYWPK